jgi:dTDP-4-dehydrorhamnose 3,5-epimerase
MDSRAIATAIPGVWVIETDFFRDERGFFIENYHRQRFGTHGITATFVQDNHSRSRQGVLRGFHYQDARAPMDKLVRCTRGKILDVVVDLRAGSPTFGTHVAVELSEENMHQLYVPHWCGHAFLTLSEIADVQYKCSSYYTPEAEGVVAWGDPDIGVAWGIANPITSQRDQHGQSLRAYLEQPAYTYSLNA